jgi:DNA ligase (NAD+)
VGEETAVLIAGAINTEFSIFPATAGPRQGGGNFQFSNLKNIILQFPKIRKEDWMRIKGIGDKSAESLNFWFNNRKNLEMLKKMKDLGVEVLIPKLSGYARSGEARQGKLQNKTFALTGELAGFTRDEAKDMIRQEGGNISSSVSVKTDYVLAGNNPGSKYTKAKELGVKVIGEKEFREMIKL